MHFKRSRSIFLNIKLPQFRLHYYHSTMVCLHTKEMKLSTNLFITITDAYLSCESIFETCDYPLQIKFSSKTEKHNYSNNSNCGCSFEQKIKTISRISTHHYYEYGATSRGCRTRINQYEFKSKHEPLSLRLNWNWNSRYNSTTINTNWREL